MFREVVGFYREVVGFYRILYALRTLARVSLPANIDGLDADIQNHVGTVRRDVCLQMTWRQGVDIGSGVQLLT